MPDIANTRILCMEDDMGLVRLMQKTLQRRGFVVDVAANGEEGLAKLKALHYDLLVVDYNMPIQNGIEVIRYLASQGALIPTIMITGEGNAMIAVEALKNGAADYLTKDADLKYLDLLPSLIDQTILKQQLMTERQQMVEAVKESEERYRLLFESNPIPIMAYDLQTLSLLAVNKAAISHYGYSLEEFLSFTINNLYTLEDIPELLHILSKLEQGGNQAGIWRHVKKNGTLIDVEITSHCILFGGRRCHFILANDVSARIKSEENLLRTHKLEALAVLTGGLAHDYNNILTAILGNISLAKLVAPPDMKDIHKYLDNAEKATTRAQNLTLRLLTFAQGGAPLKKTISAGQVLADAVDVVLAGSPYRCELKVSDSLWPIEADAGQLGQVIHNLIMNAGQSMHEGGLVTVSAANVSLEKDNPLSLAPGDYITIDVSDQGVGIPQEYFQKIFDPYFSTKHKGSGLGLAISYAVIKRHNGHISVESLQGKGSTFHIYLPANKDAVSTPEQRATAFVRGSGRILVMDDEYIITEVVSTILSRLGYEVECAADGTAAIMRYDHARKSGLPFDLVIMDLTIPDGMGGIEALGRLRELDPNVKAIVSSGYSNDPIMANFKDYGFNGVASKPYTIKKLSEVVHRVMTEGPA